MLRRNRAATSCTGTRLTETFLVDDSHQNATVCSLCCRKLRSPDLRGLCERQKTFEQRCHVQHESDIDLCPRVCLVTPGSCHVVTLVRHIRWPQRNRMSENHVTCVAGRLARLVGPLPRGSVDQRRLRQRRASRLRASHPATSRHSRKAQTSSRIARLIRYDVRGCACAVIRYQTIQAVSRRSPVTWFDHHHRGKKLASAAQS